MSWLSRQLLELRVESTDDFPTVAIAGLAAGAAYVVTQELDIRLTGRNVDDLAALGRFIVRQPRQARLVGLAIHLINSVVLALIYSRVKSKLPGPPAVRGATFAAIENLALYPITMFDENHPGIRDGSIARYWTWPAFLQSIPRHLVYGAVLGVLLRRLGAK